MKINKDVYKEIRNMNIKSKTMRGLAMDVNVDFNKSANIRSKQDTVYKKLQFYQNFVNTLNKKEG